MIGTFSRHVSIAHFLTRRYIVSTFLGKVPPDGRSRLGSTWAAERWVGMQLLLRIQREGPTAQPGQGWRFAVRPEPKRSSEIPNPKDFPAGGVCGCSDPKRTQILGD